MTMRIREAMKREPIAGLLSGRVIADETWIGGEPSNRHGHVPTKGSPRTFNPARREGRQSARLTENSVTTRSPSSTS
jgi:hypothetical protein